MKCCSIVVENCKNVNGPECRGIPVLDFKNLNGLGFQVRRDGLGWVSWTGSKGWLGFIYKE